MVDNTTRDDRPADLRRAMVVAGWVAAGFVAVGTLVGELPDGTGSVVVVALTVVGLALWLVSLNPRLTDQRLLFACLVGAGVLGAVVDRPTRTGRLTSSRSWRSPVSGCGCRGGRRRRGCRRRRRARVGRGVHVSNARGAALDVALGAGFLLVAAAFAGANRDAHDRVQEMLRLEAENASGP